MSFHLIDTSNNAADLALRLPLEKLGNMFEHARTESEDPTNLISGQFRQAGYTGEGLRDSLSDLNRPQSFVLLQWLNNLTKAVSEKLSSFAQSESSDSWIRIAKDQEQVEELLQGAKVLSVDTQFSEAKNNFQSGYIKANFDVEDKSGEFVSFELHYSFPYNELDSQKQLSLKDITNDPSLLEQCSFKAKDSSTQVYLNKESVAQTKYLNLLISDLKDKQG